MNLGHRESTPRGHVIVMHGADALRVIDPVEYHAAYMSRGVRPDGRALLRGRKPVAHSLPLSSVEGSSMMCIGHTTVLVGVRCETVAPLDSEPCCGRVVINMELPPICSPVVAAAHSGGGAGGAQRIDREKAVAVELLQRTANGGLINLEALCAAEGVAVWHCHCDIYVIEHDGNIIDVCMLAMMVALGRIRLPKVAVDEASGALTVIEEEAVRICLAAPLYACSFGVLSGRLLLDPNAAEEAVISTTFTVGGLMHACALPT